jgi:hypothetical protein
MLSTLRDTGFLLEYPSQSNSDVIRLTDPRYYTTLSEDGAKTLASALNFPLEQFTL